MNANHILSMGLLASLGSAWAKPEAQPAAQPPSTEKKGAVAPATPTAADAGIGIADVQPLPESDFKKFEPPGGGFSVMIPKDATPERPKDRSGNEIPGMWAVKGSIGKYNFVVSQGPIDAQMRAMAGSNEALISTAIYALIHSSRGTLKSITPMKYKGADAVEFVLDAPKTHVLGRIVVAGDIFYYLMIFHEESPPAYAKAYFDSLEFRVAPTTPAGTTPPSDTKK